MSRIQGTRRMDRENVVNEIVRNFSDILDNQYEFILMYKEPGVDADGEESDDTSMVRAITGIHELNTVNQFIDALVEYGDEHIRLRAQDREDENRAH